MKLLLMPKEPTWWVWLITAILLAAGLATGKAMFFLTAMALSFGQCMFFLQKHRSFAPFAVQIRLAYSTLLTVCFVPVMRWLYWLPTLGTFALVLFGYCLMARVLSLLSWNRTQRLSLDLLRRTFLTPPTLGNPTHGLPDSGCMGGICELEAKVASR